LPDECGDRGYTVDMKNKVTWQAELQRCHNAGWTGVHFEIREREVGDDDKPEIVSGDDNEDFGTKGVKIAKAGKGAKKYVNEMLEKGKTIGQVLVGRVMLLALALWHLDASREKMLLSGVGVDDCGLKGLWAWRLWSPSALSWCTLELWRRFRGFSQLHFIIVVIVVWKIATMRKQIIGQLHFALHMA
jgi:hypothetical protein